ncbi:MAG TPA: ATP-binding protein [Ktedonobacterales bacterium]|jgi:signal transduction histidine kinase|nr:ATP-binding protein [Ktedonobacterales bacterium]
MLKDELRATFLFEALSDGQLNRLMELGREVTFPTDIVLFVEGQPADLLWVLLDGKVELSRQVGGQRIVMDTMSRPGEYAGGIRAFAASDTSAGYRATGTTALPSRFFQLSSEALGRLLDELLPMAKHLLDGYVHTLEAIEASVRERGHLIALGTMAAGLTHELNNPAAAARSASGDLRDVMDRLVAQVCSVATSRVTPEQAQAMVTLQAEAVAQAGSGARLNAVETGRREEALGEWLEAHSVSNPWNLAPAFVSASLDVAWLDAAERAVGADCLNEALNWVADTLVATSLMDQIDESAARISQLVSAVKDYTSVDRAELREVEIRDGIEKTLVILGYKLRGGVEVVCDYDEHLPPVMANGSELNQVWTNLIDNAVDAMNGRGQIHIQTRRVGSDVIVEIADQGSGIPPEVASRIFEPFYTTKGVGKGTGLGLDIVRRIVVDRYHGEITFTSVPGETRFVVRLPLAS